MLKPIYQKVMRIKNRIVNGKPVLVFMYHRVDSESDPQLAKLTVSPETFEKQLAHFTENYEVVALESDWKKTRKTGVVLTFDDGYAETIATALPILEKYNAPATFFIPTENLGANIEFWWDKLAAAYNLCGNTFFLPGETVAFLKSDYSYNKISEIVVTLDNVSKYEWIEKFRRANNLVLTDRENYLPVDNAGLAEIAKHPLVRIALHTHTHPFLGKMTPDSQKTELQMSISHLKNLVVDYSNYLAVPYGSHNQDTLKVSKLLGIDGILLANDNYSNHGNKRSGKINRILMPDIHGDELIKYLKQFH